MKTNISELQEQWLNEYDDGAKEEAILDLEKTEENRDADSTL